MAQARRKTGKTVAKKEATEVAVVPSYIKQGGNRGSENVTNEDLQLPRINVCQDLSPQKDKDEEQYIEGCDVGMLFNTLTGELYPDGVVYTPITFQKRFFVWRDQDSGGGLQGIFDFNKEQEAQALTAKLNGDMEEPEYECVLTHEHLVLLDGSGDEVILSCAKSKLKVSKKFNSLIRLNGGDRFGRNYMLTSVRETNKQNGKKYYNFKVETALGRFAFPSEEVYTQAEGLYAAITEGQSYGGDYTEEGDVLETTGHAEEDEY